MFRKGLVIALMGATLGLPNGLWFKGFVDRIGPTPVFSDILAQRSVADRFIEEMKGRPVLIATGMLGILLLFTGCRQMARGKNRHEAWFLLGLLSYVGISILAMLPVRIPRDREIT